MVHFSIYVVVIYLCEHHWVSSTDREFSLVHKYIAFSISNALDVEIFDVVPPFLDWHFSYDNLPQWFSNYILSLYFTIILNFPRTVHAIGVTSNKGLPLFLRMHSISGIKSDLIFFIIQEILHADDELIDIDFSWAHP